MSIVNAVVIVLRAFLVPRAAIAAENLLSLPKAPSRGETLEVRLW